MPYSVSLGSKKWEARKVGAQIETLELDVSANQSDKVETFSPKRACRA